jgi:hypothetical protein
MSFYSFSIDYLVNQINEYARKRNVEIVQIASFEKDSDFYALVVFKKGGAE